MITTKKTQVRTQPISPACGHGKQTSSMVSADKELFPRLHPWRMGSCEGDFIFFSPFQRFSFLLSDKASTCSIFFFFFKRLCSFTAQQECEQIFYKGRKPSHFRCTLSNLFTKTRKNQKRSYSEKIYYHLPFFFSCLLIHTLRTFGRERHQIL